MADSSATVYGCRGVYRIEIFINDVFVCLAVNLFEHKLEIFSVLVQYFKLIRLFGFDRFAYIFLIDEQTERNAWHDQNNQQDAEQRQTYKSVQ